MARFFAKEPGARVMVQGFGAATTEAFVEVPESMAAELRKHPGLVDAGFKVTLHGSEAVIPVEKVEAIALTKRNRPSKGDKE